MDAKTDHTCPECGKKVQGRLDKRFCSPECKSAYHYREGKEQREASLYAKVSRILRTNRRLMSRYNKAGLATVEKERILADGFNPRFFTHYWRNSKGEVYWFCYEYGFREVENNGKAKYILVVWQAYMEKGFLGLS